MKDTYNYYQDSDITMLAGHQPPPDSVCLGMIDSRDPAVAMAVYLVCGSKEVGVEDGNNIFALSPILSALRNLQMRDIQKVINMPMEWLMRWNASFEQAVKEGIISDESAMSVTELNTAFEE